MSGSMTEFRAVQELLSHSSIASRTEPLLRHVPATEDRPEHGVILWDSLQELGAQQFSDGERVLLELAWQLWSGRKRPLVDLAAPVTITDALQWLDEEGMARLATAVNIKRGRATWQPAAELAERLGRRVEELEAGAESSGANAQGQSYNYGVYSGWISGLNEVIALIGEPHPHEPGVPA